MINNKRIVALIPARGGSKSIPKKNIALLMGKPLIGWTIEAALNTEEIDRIIVSTDSTEIATIANSYGAEVKIRPDLLSKDDSLVIDTIFHVLKELKGEGEAVDYLVLLEPTAPLRSREDIQKSIELLDREGYDSVATYTEASLNPHRAWTIKNNKPEVFIDGAIPWLPRQKQPKAYQLNGAVYVIKISELREDIPGLVFGYTGAVIMPKERSIDIDDEVDFLIAEMIMKKQIEGV